MNKILFILILLISNNSFCQKEAFVEIGPTDKSILDFCFNKSGDLIFISHSNQIDCYEVKTNKLLDVVYKNDSLPFFQITYSYLDSALAMISKNGYFFIKYLNKDENHTFQVPHQQLTCLSCTSPLNYILIGTTSGSILKYNTEGQLIEEIKNHDDIINDVTISPNNKYYASAGMDGKAYLSRLDNNDQNQLLKLKKPLRNIKFNSQSNRIITCSDNGKIYEWKINPSGRFQLLYKARLSGWVTGLSYFNDNVWAAVSSKGKILINTQQGISYKAKDKNILIKTEFVPNQLQLKVVVLTYSKELKLYKAEKMNFNL